MSHKQRWGMSRCRKALYRDIHHAVLRITYKHNYNRENQAAPRLKAYYSPRHIAFQTRMVLLLSVTELAVTEHITILDILQCVIYSPGFMQTMFTV
jgi:hypothetical protein